MWFDLNLCVKFVVFKYFMWVIICFLIPGISNRPMYLCWCLLYLAMDMNCSFNLDKYMCVHTILVCFNGCMYWNCEQDEWKLWIHTIHYILNLAPHSHSFARVLSGQQSNGCKKLQPQTWQMQQLFLHWAKTSPYSHVLTNHLDFQRARFLDSTCL